MRRVAVPLTLTRENARPRAGRFVRLGGPTMGVTWNLSALAPVTLDDAAISATVQGECDVVVAQMSTWEPESDLSRFNRAAAGTWVAAPEPLITVVAAALEVSRLSGGAFDPTIGRIVDLWGFGPAGAVLEAPGVDALDRAETDWRALRMDERSGRLFQPGGLALDLSGVAKGYGVDRAAEALRTIGVRDFLLEIGGELRGSGVKGDGSPWWVDVESPPDAGDLEPSPLIALHGLAIATSGDWRRSFDAGGVRYSHTIDPRTRRPVSGDLTAVAVLHPSCMQADALATALLVLGAEAEAFARDHHIAARLLFREAGAYRERLSPAFDRLLA